MNTDGTPPGDPVGTPPVTAPTREEGDAAVAYVERELRRAARSLSQTRIICTILVVCALVETLYVTTTMQKYLQPKQAADVTDGIIMQRLNDQEPQIKDAIAAQLPKLVGGLPDQAINQMPTYRQDIENRFTSTMSSYAKSSSQQLDSQMDTLLQSHKEDVHDALIAGQNQAAVHKLATEMTDGFMDSLKTTSDNGETLQSKIDTSLANLQDVKKTMDRLAANKNLSPQDKRTRHMIAILAKTISTQTPQGNTPQAIATAQNAVASKL